MGTSKRRGIAKEGRILLSPEIVKEEGITEEHMKNLSKFLMKKIKKEQGDKRHSRAPILLQEYSDGLSTLEIQRQYGVDRTIAGKILHSIIGKRTHEELSGIIKKEHINMDPDRKKEIQGKRTTSIHSFWAKVPKNERRDPAKMRWDNLTPAQQDAFIKSGDKTGFQHSGETIKELKRLGETWFNNLSDEKKIELKGIYNRAMHFKLSTQEMSRLMKDFWKTVPEDQRRKRD